MASLRNMSHGKIEGYKIDPREIVIREGFNYRDCDSPEAQRHIAWLKESIRDRGVDTPIWVENLGPSGYALIDGECRLRALRQLWDEGIEVYVPTIVYQGDESAVLAKSLIANGSLPPTLLEFGRAAERLLAYGWSVEKIAQHTPPHVSSSPARARKYVEDSVELQQAPLAVKEAVAHGVEGVTVTPALAISATRQNRIMAPEIIREAAEAAKAAGKAVATRPKGAGVATIAKEAQALATEKLLKVGDKMAELLMSEQPSWDEMEKLAKQWRRLRAPVAESEAA